MTDDAALFGEMTTGTFLANHWQKRPLLVRGALRDVACGPTLTDLRALAAEAHVSSRLIVAPREDSGWTVRRGPFAAEEHDGLPADGWTLLVHEVDRYLPACAGLLERFRFAPNWRLDDLMASYAADGGGIGPHLDRYDVFLVQTSGRRRWRIESVPRTVEQLDASGPIPWLADFRPDEQWVLEPGDLLYLPPRFAHEGVALGPCVTCSVGFRVPDPRELCAGFVRQLDPGRLDAVRHSDPELPAGAPVGEIAAEARRALRDAARSLFTEEGGFDLWLGRCVTTPLRGMPADDGTRAGAAARLWERVGEGEGLRRSAAAHFAWFRDGAGALHLFVGGEHYPLGPGDETRAELLCGRRALNPAALSELAEDERIAEILIDLVRRGFLR